MFEQTINRVKGGVQWLLGRWKQFHELPPIAKIITLLVVAVAGIYFGFLLTIAHMLMDFGLWALSHWWPLLNLFLVAVLGAWLIRPIWTARLVADIYNQVRDRVGRKVKQEEQAGLVGEKTDDEQTAKKQFSWKVWTLLGLGWVLDAGLTCYFLEGFWLPWTWLMFGLIVVGVGLALLVRVKRRFAWSVYLRVLLLVGLKYGVLWVTLSSTEFQMGRTETVTHHGQGIYTIYTHDEHVYENRADISLRQLHYPERQALLSDPANTGKTFKVWTVWYRIPFFHTIPNIIHAELKSENTSSKLPTELGVLFYTPFVIMGLTALGMGVMMLVSRRKVEDANADEAPALDTTAT